MKYGNKGDNFDLKLIMFYNVYTKTYLPREVSYIVFLIILKGRALAYYYTDLIHLYLSFKELYDSVRNYYKDKNY